MNENANPITTALHRYMRKKQFDSLAEFLGALIRGYTELICMIAATIALCRISKKLN